MDEKNKYDHKRLGRQSWYYVYPPTRIPDLTGFEDGLPVICQEKIEILLSRGHELKLRRDEWVKKIKDLNKPGSLEETCLKTWAAAEFAEYYLIQKWLRYWTKLWRMVTNKPLPKKRILGRRGIDDRDIERAREKPIEELFEGRLRKVGTRLMGLCVFHEENSPSFCVYPDENTYHCFGCQAHGDVIDFVMKTKGISFVGAVRSLI